MIRAGVMIAKVVWNMKKAGSGIVPQLEPRSPFRNTRPRPPISGAFPSNARL